MKKAAGSSNSPHARFQRLLCVARCPRFPRKFQDVDGLEVQNKVGSMYVIWDLSLRGATVRGLELGEARPASRALRRTLKPRASVHLTLHVLARSLTSSPPPVMHTGS